MQQGVFVAWGSFDGVGFVRCGGWDASCLLRNAGRRASSGGRRSVISDG